MTQTDLQLFFDHLATLFMDRDLAGLARHFTYPQPLYLQEGFAVFGSQGVLCELLALFQDAVISREIHAIAPRVIAIGLSNGAYSSVWVSWDHQNALQHTILSTQTRFALRLWEGRAHPQIEWTEMTSCHFPELLTQIPLFHTG